MFLKSLLLQSTTRKHSCHGPPTDPGVRQTEEKGREKAGEKRQQYIKCFSFNETNPKDVQSGSRCAVHKHGKKQTNRRTEFQHKKLTQDQAGLATRGVSPGWHWGRSHWAGHRSSGHWLLFHLGQVGLEVCVHIFMYITFPLEV